MSTQIWTTEKIARLIEGFEAGTWPCQEWTHQAHLVMGLWYLSRHSPDKALIIIREAIKRYNVSCGGQNTETSGYHETITRFYVWYIDQYLRDTVAGDLADLATVFCRDHGDKDLPLRYYSRERLMSVEARADWMEPDLQQLT